MRPLHSKQWKFEEFLDSSIPISLFFRNTWGKDEISYQALQLAIKERGATEKLQLSSDEFSKIERCRQEAAAKMNNWVWIDTCCIKDCRLHGRIPYEL